MRELTLDEVDRVSGGWSFSSLFSAVADTLGFDGKFGYQGGASFGGASFSGAWNAVRDFFGADGKFGYQGSYVPHVDVGDPAFVIGVNGQAASGIGLSGDAGIYVVPTNGDFGVYTAAGGAAGGGASASLYAGTVSSVDVLMGISGSYSFDVGPSGTTLIASPGSGSGVTINLINAGSFAGGTSTYGNVMSFRDGIADASSDFTSRYLDEFINEPMRSSYR